MGATKEEVNLKVFLWDYTEKIVISDIDGTITRSDIAGQLLTNYIHVGVVKLFT
jgi:phosphatidate phosphatase LPIN